METYLQNAVRRQPNVCDFVVTDWVLSDKSFLFLCKKHKLLLVSFFVHSIFFLPIRHIDCAFIDEQLMIYTF